MSVPDTRTLLFVLGVAVNGFTFLIFGWDKLCAKLKKRRVPERTLMTFAVLGGALGALTGMVVFQHKTRHKKFTILVPVLLVLQVALIWVLKMGL